MFVYQNFLKNCSLRRYLWTQVRNQLIKITSVWCTHLPAMIPSSCQHKYCKPAANKGKIWDAVKWSHQKICHTSQLGHLEWETRKPGNLGSLWWSELGFVKIIPVQYCSVLNHSDLDALQLQKYLKRGRFVQLRRPVLCICRWIRLDFPDEKLFIFKTANSLLKCKASKILLP